jgi:5-methylcytosine-specific restriction endonuclease McrA
MAAFVEQLKRRRQAVLKHPKTRAAPESPQPAVRMEASGAEGSAPERIPELPSERHAPERTMEAAARGAERKRHVPAAIRRAIWSRDSGRCTFTEPGGQRCHERAGLELHHEHAFALGGRTTAENLRLVCRAHNGLLAERDFGWAHIERRRKGRRLTSATKTSGLSRT